MRKDTKSDSLESWKQSVEDVGSISVMSVSNVARLRSIARRNAGTKQPCAGSGKRISVYDLTIEGNHEFFANGVLVHNCEHDDDVDAVSGAMKQLAYGSVNLA
jgi:phage terminase large subunit-like protein